jgi:hypothetical protein
MGTSSKFSTKREAIAVDGFGEYGIFARRDFYVQSRRYCCVFSDCVLDFVKTIDRALGNSECDSKSVQDLDNCDVSGVANGS